MPFFFLKPRTIGLFFVLLLLGACETEKSVSTDPLPSIAMNEGAGRGGHLIVMLQLESGKKQPFILDTGSPITVLDESLVPGLGKRLDTMTLWRLGVKEEAGFYVAPKLYLEGAELMIGTNVLTAHCQPRSMGILGMDCLKHYCIQLDFEAAKIRFLDPRRLAPEKLGKAFRLRLSSEVHGGREFISPYIHCANLVGGKKTDVLVDTGCDIDGYLEPGLFAQQVKEQKVELTKEGLAKFLACVWNGQIYTDVLIGDAASPNVSIRGKGNLIGLGFLARHLVTLDFPERTIYLERTSVGPLIVEKAERPVMSVLKFQVP